MRAKICATILGLALFLSPSTTHSSDKAHIDCLAVGMYHEARGETVEGMKGVGYVLVNRTKAKQFPSNICSVLYQPGEFTNIRKLKVTDWKTYNKVYKVAEKVYASPNADNTHGALFFHEKSVRPSWSMKYTFTVKIGNHKFYRL